MRKIIWLVIALLLLSTKLFAETYYVRPDGGTSVQCTGKTDSAYPGQGVNQACAFIHPFYVTGVIPNGGGAPAKWIGGDTMVIKKGAYKMGYGAPNSNGSPTFPYDVIMRSIPSGTAQNHTKILGEGWDTGCTSPPELWGNEKAYTILNMQGASSYVDVNCVEITDHSSCREGGQPLDNICNAWTFPYGEWGQNGIIAVDSTNVTLTNVNIHGMGYTGLYTARIKDWTMDGLKLNGNGQVGWHGEYKQGASSNSGDIVLRNSQVTWNGCSESYPGKKSPVSCCSQGQGCYTDGIGMADSGGNYLIENDEISWNSEDGLDLLHVSTDPTSKVIVRGSRFEGNSGNDIKTGAASVVVENNVGIGACNFIGDNFAIPGYDNWCRAGGEVLAVDVLKGSKQRVVNNTFVQLVAGKNASIIDNKDGNCDGTEKVEFRNNIWYGGNYIPYDDISNCTGWSLKDDAPHVNSLFYKTTPVAGNLNADPKFVGDFSTYKPYTSTALRFDSPAVGIGATSPTPLPEPLPACIVSSCNAPQPACGATTTGLDNCGGACSKLGAICPPVCVPNGICQAATPSCGKTTQGVDNCANICYSVGPACPPLKPYTSLSGFESWLTSSTIKTADTQTISRFIKQSSGVGSNKKFQCYKVQLQSEVCE